MADEDSTRGTDSVRPGAVTALMKELAAARPPPETALPVLFPGAVVGRFAIGRELGRGAFGVVHEAQDRELPRSVALKMIRPGKAQAGNSQLFREAEAVARLSHPNLVTLFEVGRTDQGPFLVFELLRGKTLQQRLDEGPLPVAEAVHIAAEVARGLAHAHGEGVFHRDLKPSNVFLTDRGQVKVLDFGMAHAFGWKRLAGGTPAYMAPEQWQGAPEDERTDVFALGVLLYRMLCGDHPFPDDGGKWASGPHLAPRLAAPEAPGLEELVARMLAQAPTDRPRDGAAVLETLEALEGQLRWQPAAGPAQVTARRSVLPARWAPPGRRQRRRRLAAYGLALGLVAALSGAAWSAWEREGAPASAPGSPVADSSIAVLPFADLSPRHDQEYFADGVAEEILNALVHVRGLKVIGRTSSFSFRGEREDLRRIGQKLAVAHVLEGSLRKDGDSIRVTAQLVRVADGASLWSQNYDRRLAGIFQVQDEVARAVVEALRGALLPGRQGPGERPSTTPAAYDQYLLGLQGSRQTAEAVARAIAAFERAVALDPDYAPAWAQLAMTTFWKVTVYGGDSKAELARASTAAARAISLAPGLAEGYLARGLIRSSVDWNWKGAQADFERALALDPGASLAKRRYGVLLCVMGRLEDGVRWFEAAVALEPLDSGSWNALGDTYVNLSRMDLARHALRRGLSVAPGDVLLLQNLGDIDLLEGHAESALATYGTINSELFRLEGEAMALHSLGRDEESRELLAKLEAGFGASHPGNVAEVHGWRGDKEAAFHWLERAATTHDPALRDIKNNRYLRALRGDPRYATLLRRMKLPVDGPTTP